MGPGKGLFPSEQQGSKLYLTFTINIVATILIHLKREVINLQQQSFSKGTDSLVTGVVEKCGSNSVPSLLVVYIDFLYHIDKEKCRIEEATGSCINI